MKLPASTKASAASADIVSAKYRRNSPPNNYRLRRCGRTRAGGGHDDFLRQADCVHGDLLEISGINVFLQHRREMDLHVIDR